MLRNYKATLTQIAHVLPPGARERRQNDVHYIGMLHYALRAAHWQSFESGSYCFYHFNFKFFMYPRSVAVILLLKYSCALNNYCAKTRIVRYQSFKPLYRNDVNNVIENLRGRPSLTLSPIAYTTSSTFLRQLNTNT